MKSLSKCLSVLLVLVAFGQLSLAADRASGSNPPSELKPYSPFDEPKPKIPEEMLSDVRLGRKVKVYAKSMNLKDLFAGLSAKTGVKIAPSRELDGERVIIYFHNRQLRDVMTEISGLLGYCWLVKGEKDAYRYELFEDLRHSKRREQIRKERNDADLALLSALAKAVSQDSAELQQLKQSDSETYIPLTRTGKLLSQFDDAFLKSMLVQEKSSFSFKEFPQALRLAILEWRNDLNRWRWNQEERRMVEVPSAYQYKLSDLESASLGFRRVSQGLFGFPHFELEVTTKQQGNWVVQWPPWPLQQDDLWKFAGSKPPQLVGGDVSIPDKPTVTKRADRRIFQFGAGQPVLLIGDVVQAIAEQSEYDIIADYQFQPGFYPGYAKEPLSAVVKRLCATGDYSCRMEGSTLRFRFNQWYVRGLMDEPPSKLTERMWVAIEQTGRMQLGEILDMAVLPQSQMTWPGFEFMPGANIARTRPATLCLWASLRPYAEAQARTKEGLRVPHLDPNQMEKFRAWAKAMQVKATPEELVRGVIRTSHHTQTMGTRDGDGFAEYEYEQIKLVLPGREPYQMQLSLPPPLTDKDRKELAAQRRKDAEADRIEALD